MKPHRMVQVINEWRAMGGSVAVEMFRDGMWIDRAELVEGMLALYIRPESVTPDFLIPEGTPIILRMAQLKPVDGLPLVFR